MAVQRRFCTPLCPPPVSVPCLVMELKDVRHTHTDTLIRLQLDLSDFQMKSSKLLHEFVILPADVGPCGAIAIVFYCYYLFFFMLLFLIAFIRSDSVER